MNNYLLQLLKEVKTLIIPGLGALTVTNETTGEIMFMPYLKFDDGTLAQHISSKEGMDINDAKNLIAKFVRDVQTALDKGDSYDMYEFGSFKKIDGEISFLLWGEGNGTSGSTSTSENEVVSEITPELEPIPAPVIEPKPVIVQEPEQEQKQEPEPEQEPETSPAPVVETEPEVEQEREIIPEPIIEPTPESVQESEIVVPVTPEIVLPAESIKESTFTQSEITEKKPEPIVSKKDTKTASKKATPKADKPKKKTSLLAYILWGVFTLIIGAGIFIFVKFDELKKDFPILADLAGESSTPATEPNDSSTTLLSDEPGVNMDENTESEPLPTDDIEGLESASDETAEVSKEIKSEPVKVEKSNKLAPVKTTPKKTTPKKTTPVKPKSSASSNVGSANMSLSYHIIAGSFGSEANAKRLASSLQGKGYNEAAVMQNNGMYRVSVKGFTSQGEAAGAAKNMQADVPGAWVLKL